MSLTLTGITKRFGAVTALDAADFSAEAGTVHALLGENGAGKSTLMHIAYGLVRPDQGRIAVRGREVTIRSPREARALGIGMVHQHFTSVPALTVAENIALAAGVRRPASSSAAMDQLLRGLDPGARVEDLSVGLRQRLEIVKALAGDASILLLDEPTAVLAPPEIEELVRIIRDFAVSGGAVVLITHKLGEALAAADRVTVLRQGRVVLTGPVSGQTPETLAAAMLGAGGPADAAVADRGPRPSGPVIAVFDGVSVPPVDGRGPGLRSASLELRAGEIVGVAAVDGNGQRELLLAAAGVLAPSAGRLTLERPVALVPEDRTTEGLVPEMDLTENVVLGLGRSGGWVRGPWIAWELARARTMELLAAFDVRAPGPDVRVAALSGGNQQKLVLARALEREPRLLVAENPTRGLDIRAAAAVQARLREAARLGIAVLLYSSDLDEVLELADRVLVVSNGTVTDAGVAGDRNQVGRAMLGLPATGAA